MPTYTSRLGLPLPLGTEFHNLENYKSLINTIDAKASSKAEFDAHTANKSNPHATTAAQVGAYTKAEADVELATGLSTKTNLRGYSNGAVTEINGTDLNNLTESGTFMGMNLINAPDASWWFIVNQVHNSNYITQIAYIVTETSDRPRIRKKSNGVWGAWQALQFTSDNSVSATKLQTARTIAGVAFDGTSNISIPAGNVGAYTKAEVDSRIATTVGGNVASATKLQTARTINGVAFDGTSNINILSNPEVTTIPVNADLNDYPQAGFYGCPVSANVATLKNCPTTVAFTMITLAGNTSSDPSICTQIISEYGTGAGSKLYIRRKYSGSETPWGSWYPIGTADGTLQNGLYAQTASRLATARAITLTGGVTGSATFDGTSTTTISTTITGNAPTATTATKLATARTIAGVSFDGTANIAIPAGNVGAYTKTEVDTALTEGLAKKTNTTGYSNGVVTLISGDLNDLAVSGMFMGPNLSNTPDGVSGKWWFIQSMVHNNLYRTQVAYQFTNTNTQQWQRNLTNGTWQAWRLVATTVDNVASATKLQTARTIALTGGVTGSTTFDGSGNVSISATVTGNAPSATKLATARTINGTAFDGTSNITVTADPTQNIIPENSNLDNFATSGFYESPSNAHASTLANAPFTSSFSLIVQRISSTRVVQRAVSNAGHGTELIRSKTDSSGWTAWYRTPTSDGSPQADLVAESASKLTTARTVALTGAVTGSVAFDGSSNATIATTVDAFDIQYAVGNNLTVIPKWDCIAEVYVQFSGWGYDGKKWAVGINTPQGTTQVVRGVGVLEGDNLVSNHVSYTSIFIGLKKGESYLFQRETFEGRVGQVKDDSLIAKLYRQN